MIIKINDFSSSYWAGLAIINAGISVGFAFSWLYYLGNIAINVLPMIGVSFYFFTQNNNKYAFLSSVFLASISLVCAVGRWYYIKLSKSEYQSRLKLADEIESRNKIIEIKTQESIRLNSLSKQFSPQIVQSIESGKFSLSSTIHNSDICAIFVDIKDSTTKFSKLNRENLQKIISLYLEDVMNIFLKYDITIDKFLGDGIMGFTNDPMPQKDYIERAILAAIEVKNRISLKQEIYNVLWGSIFEIRIGISCGEASVGFYGNDLHVKSYTAIGRVVNLASRVNGIAPSNQVAVTQEVILKLSEVNENYLKDFNISEFYIDDLKGFENEKINVFTIDKIENVSQIDDENCPSGHGPLVISQLNNGIYIMKCRYCDFVLDEKNQDNLTHFNKVS